MKATAVNIADKTFFFPSLCNPALCVRRVIGV